MKRVYGAGLNKEEAEKVQGLYGFDELWEYLENQGIEPDRIDRLARRIAKALERATAEEMIDARR